jgi:tetratricopeptide (TPR) repeat protein
MDMLSPEEIAAEIHESLDFLEVDQHDVPERHKSVRAVFDYTWKLLSEEERDTLKKVTVFRGGFTAKAGREIVGASHRLLHRLVNKSLIHRDNDGRLDLHELLRQYAEEKFDPEEKIELGNRHCDYFSDFLEERNEQNQAGPQTESLREIDNIRACWSWSVEQDRFDAIRKSWFSFFFVFQFQGWRDERRASFQDAVEKFRTDKPSGERGIAYGLCLGCLAFGFDDFQKRLDYIRESHSIIREIGNDFEIAVINLFLAIMDPGLNFEEEISLYEESISIADRINVTYIKASALVYMGGTTALTGQLTRAVQIQQKALELIEASNNYRLAAECYDHLGGIAIIEEDYSKALSLFKESISFAQKAGYLLHARGNHSTLIDIYMAMEDYQAAQELLEEGLSLDRSMGNQLVIIDRSHTRGVLAYELGEFSEADGYFQDAMKLTKEINHKHWIGAIKRDQANLALAQGDVRAALENFHFALQVGQEHQQAGFDWLSHYVLAGVALLLTGMEENERAVELHTMALNYPRWLCFRRVKSKKQLTALQGKMSTEKFTNAQQRGEKREIQATTDKMLSMLDKLIMENESGARGP